jgi:hypothetical protein
MNKYETFALSQVFHSYPENKTFDEICELCKNDEAREAFNEEVFSKSLENADIEDQQLIVCERYESEWWENLPIILKELAENAKYHISDEEFNSFEVGLLSALLDKYINENKDTPFRSKHLELSEKLTRLASKYYQG